MSVSRRSTYGSSRQSTLAGSSQPDSALAEMCVAGTINCIETLEDSLIDLDEQNRELKRIGDAIKYNRVYVLVPEKTVREYSIQQSSEIEPQITEMLQLAEKSIKNLERKETILKSRVS
ncbi:hypothetical protein DL93DRAFT_2079898 [Clavulina sp. PMI_390]|nr:hypothetical protein DL93DRAFT_2079898 [Clavulina sp. PMI_390]